MALDRRRFITYGLGATTLGALSGCGVVERGPWTPFLERRPWQHHFVLVHGAWVGSRYWDRTAGALKSAAHQVTIVDLPGRGRSAAAPDHATLASYTKAVTDALRDSPVPATVVGHCLGGMAISQAAELYPDKVRALVFVAAVVMGDDESALSRRDPRSSVLPLVRSETRPGSDVALRTHIDTSKPELVRAALFNDLSVAAAARAIGDLHPEPSAPAAERLQLTQDRFGRIEKIYVICNKDTVITPAMQRDHASKWPTRKVVGLDSGHYPMLSMPDRLAQVLATEMWS